MLQLQHVRIRKLAILNLNVSMHCQGLEFCLVHQYSMGNHSHANGLHSWHSMHGFETHPAAARVAALLNDCYSVRRLGQRGVELDCLANADLHDLDTYNSLFLAKNTL